MTERALRDCEENYKKCDNDGCEQRFKHDATFSTTHYGHMLNHCPKRLVICTDCDAEILSDMLQAHSEVCSERTVICAYCGIELRDSAFELHCEKSALKSMSTVLCSRKLALVVSV